MRAKGSKRRWRVDRRLRRREDRGKPGDRGEMRGERRKIGEERAWRGGGGGRQHERKSGSGRSRTGVWAWALTESSGWEPRWDRGSGSSSGISLSSLRSLSGFPGGTSAVRNKCFFSGRSPPQELPSQAETCMIKNQERRGRAKRSGGHCRPVNKGARSGAWEDLMWPCQSLSTIYTRRFTYWANTAHEEIQSGNYIRTPVRE